MEDHMTSHRLALLTFVCALVAFNGYAQTSTAALSGTVSDASNAVLPGVNVSATDISTGRTFTAVTNDSGEYRLSNLAPSAYMIKLQKGGFATIELQRIELLVGQSANRNFSMKVASAGETISVTSEAPLIDTERS